MDALAPAVLVLGPGGLGTGRAVAAALPGARLHVRGLDPVPDRCVAVGEVGPHLRALFREGRPVVGICAAGILIRSLAPALADKRAEPPVLAVAEDGGCVVPLLGGHHGANELARRLAGRLGGRAAVTTAGDHRFGIALDEPPPGWTLANPGDAKEVTAALLAGGCARLAGSAPWLAGSRLPVTGPGDPAAVATLETTARRATGGPGHLVYHPAVLALGVGCERGTEPGELAGLVQAVLDDHGLATASVAAVVSLDLKEDEPAVLALAGQLGVPLRVFAADTLEAETPRLANPSAAVFREVGCHGVAEAAALAAAGPEAELIVAKTRSRRATCAVARAPAPIDPEAVGRARGRLAVVGLGPGGPAWRTPEAAQALAEATDVVGYSGYLDLLEPAAPEQARHGFALGEETERVDRALGLAAAGRSVALVSSGDPGIYAMAALVAERLDRAGRADWQRIDLAVVPGLSALQLAAARAGAPLGHDFCAVSLSDLLTPWPVIERRLAAAGAGDFVLALYNPVSQRRTAQLERARAILLRHRPAATPVVLARSLGRPAERVEITDLGTLAPAMADMLTVILVGSRETRLVPRRHGRPLVYTPRGYADRSGSRDDG